MINQVCLKGFQSHVDTEFNLHTGLNVITGPSDAGKTAIIRAVRWVAFNEPQGESFVNEAVGSAEVKIVLDKAIITKTRKKSKTSYLIQQDESDEGSLFEKSEVPAEVKTLLGIEKHSFGDFESALNFSFQLDAPFLISETASAGAKVLGKLAGTESVDLAIKGVSKDTYATRNMRSQAEKDMERIVGSLFEYQHIDDAKQSLETAEMLFEQVETSYEKLETLKEYRNSFLLSKENVDNLIQKLNKLQDVPQLLENITEIEKFQQRHTQLLQLQDDGNRLRNRISSLEQRLNNFEDITLASDLVNSINIDTDQLTNINILCQSYQKYTENVNLAAKTLEKTSETIPAARTLDTIDADKLGLELLQSIQLEYQNAKDGLTAAEGRLNSFGDLSTFEEQLNVLSNDAERFATAKELQKEHLIADQLLNNAEQTLQDASKLERISNDELQQAWSEAGGVCPLCESVVCEHG